MLEKLNETNINQKNLMSSIKEENCDDIHSILRIKCLIESIIQLEIEKKLLLELIIKK